MGMSQTQSFHRRLGRTVHEAPPQQDLQPLPRPLRTGRHHVEHVLGLATEPRRPNLRRHGRSLPIRRHLQRLPPTQLPTQLRPDEHDGRHDDRTKTTTTGSTAEGRLGRKIKRPSPRRAVGVSRPVTSQRRKASPHAQPTLQAHSMCRGPCDALRGLKIATLSGQTETINQRGEPRRFPGHGMRSMPTTFSQRGAVSSLAPIARRARLPCGRHVVVCPKHAIGTRSISTIVFALRNVDFRINGTIVSR